MGRLTLFTAILMALLWIEHVRPLRARTQDKSKRAATNLLFGALGYLLIGLTLYPSLIALCSWVSAHGFGMSVFFPSWARPFFLFLALDYTLYIWHWLNHRVAFFWRFHLVHHVDLDLDVTTASRFHMGELLWSVGFRALQIVIIGVDATTLILYEAAVTTFAQFHHSNIRLPLKLEKILCYVIVTPRMHGVHHSIVENEQNTNFSTILSIWDRLHRSIRLNVLQADITMGVASLLDRKIPTLWSSLLLPFASVPAPKPVTRPSLGDHKTTMRP